VSLSRFTQVYLWYLQEHTEHRRRTAIYLALIVMLAHLGDLLTFLQVVKVVGIEGEANPIIRYVFRLGGFWGVIGFKAFAVGFWVAVFQSRTHRVFSLFFAGVGIVGALLNTLALFLFLGP